LFKNKIIKNCPTVSYSMPALENFPLSGEDGPRSSKADLEAIEREAFEKGFDSGQQAGYEIGEQKAAVLLSHLEKLFKEIYSLKEKMLAEVEPQMVLLSVTLARQILKEELKSSPEVVEKMVKEALIKISKIGPITIKLNQPLYDRLVKKKKEFQEIFPDLIFELDTKAPEGGAVVRNMAEEIQTDLDFQLSNMIEDLRTHLENA
jgi:Flagellar biosynthesis/type III secretory pathway protein